jgi:hypothetical protein
VGGSFRETVTFSPEAVSRGAAFGDIDNDGDIDIVVPNNNGPVWLLLNDSTGGRSLQTSLVGTVVNRQGLGARVTLLREGETPMRRRVQTDGSYLSASDSRVHFGLGTRTTIRGIIVEWPDGTREQWSEITGPGFLTLKQGTGTRSAP